MMNRWLAHERRNHEAPRGRDDPSHDELGRDEFGRVGDDAEPGPLDTAPTPRGASDGATTEVGRASPPPSNVSPRS
ncbi:hypothetical protein SPF06_14875 [Sinomonas sp. JGH33]|uniref:Uncharacterized protein n=1 Tax=Sinomonas terricola TaxID=3110330 RepID=A0ABU5T8K5_9MICC|nr:hypothetical protein [Sinomonas sp. JGH33]MEA5456017.1 hypothetical protein [Sinomonas sp. JGH33]